MDMPTVPSLVACSVHASRMRILQADGVGKRHIPMSKLPTEVYDRKSQVLLRLRFPSRALRLLHPSGERRIPHYAHGTVRSAELRRCKPCGFCRQGRFRCRQLRFYSGSAWRSIRAERYHSRVRLVRNLDTETKPNHPPRRTRSIQNDRQDIRAQPPA